MFWCEVAWILKEERNRRAPIYIYVYTSDTLEWNYAFTPQVSDLLPNEGDAEWLTARGYTLYDQVNVCTSRAGDCGLVSHVIHMWYTHRRESRTCIGKTPRSWRLGLGGGRRHCTYTIGESSFAPWRRWKHYRSWRRVDRARWRTVDCKFGAVTWDKTAWASGR